jgi:hypothetical protein
MQSTFWIFLIATSVHHTLSLECFAEHQMRHVMSELTKAIAKRNCSQDRCRRGF